MQDLPSFQRVLTILLGNLNPNWEHSRFSCVAANLEIHVHHNDCWKNQYSSNKVRMVPNFNSVAQL